MTGVEYFQLKCIKVYNARHLLSHSTDYEVAWSFCNPAPTGWRGSCLGNKLRAMLVCQVDTELLTCDNATEGSSRCG